MLKRPHSPATDQTVPFKKHQVTYVDYFGWPLGRTFDAILSDETVLLIFGFLDPYHLCLVQAVNKHWNRLATDNHLWRIMFMREFSQQRLRGSRGFSQHTNRNIRPLPKRAHQDQDDLPIRDFLPENYTDWRWMYRISSNWGRGRCAVSTQRVHNRASRSLSPVSPSAYSSQGHYCDSPSALKAAVHLLLAGDLTIYALPKPSAAPEVYIFRSDINSGLVIPYHTQSSQAISVTSLALDHSSAELRLAIFYSNDTWNIYNIDYEHRTSNLAYSQPTSVALSSSSVIQAAYHHPLLVTLTSTFHLSIFYLPPPPSAPIPKYTLWSYSVHLPFAMTVSKYRTPEQYRVLLAHSIPIYPAHWAPSATDITLSTGGGSDSMATNVLSSVTTNNSLPVGWIPVGAPTGIPEELRLRWLRKVSHVSGIQTDGKFVVFASEDGGIQVYRLHRNARLLYERTLFPPRHAPSPRALSVADSRCVCATQDGEIWIWDLESGMGVRASDADSEGNQATQRLGIVRVAFDARRVVAVNSAGAIRTYDFDI